MNSNNELKGSKSIEDRKIFSSVKHGPYRTTGVN